MAKCPHCEKTLTYAKAEVTEVRNPKKKWQGVFYVCPYCHSILSVSVDPILIMDKCVAAITKSLKEKTS